MPSNQPDVHMLTQSVLQTNSIPTNIIYSMHNNQCISCIEYAEQHPKIGFLLKTAGTHPRCMIHM